MSVTDPVADMLTRVRNACLAGHRRVDMPVSKLKVAIAAILRDNHYIQDYKVLTTEAHGATDWNLLLMTQAKDLASVEANQEKVDAMMQKVVGDDQKQMQGYKDRESMREPLGSRVAREVVLEPKP